MRLQLNMRKRFYACITFDAIIRNEKTKSTTYTVASWQSLENSTKLLFLYVCIPTVNRLTVEIFNG